MSKIYITFGQGHTHRVNNKTFDCDCVAVINAIDEEAGRTRAHELFGPQWSTSYTEEMFIKGDFMKYFPRGEMEVEG